MTLTHCPFCGNPSDDAGSIRHGSGCLGLEPAQMNRLQHHALASRLAEAERDAARYRWLRTRINWRDRQHSFATNRTAPVLTTDLREWMHVDVRSTPRPQSEHIDEYIDGQLRATNSADPVAKAAADALLLGQGMVRVEYVDPTETVEATPSANTALDLNAPFDAPIRTQQARDAAAYTEGLQRQREYMVTDEFRGLVRRAYEAGAKAAHENYQPDRAPDFTEAAHDYAATALTVKAGQP